MKFFADQHWTERRDWVVLKLQPYKQQSVAVRKSLKLTSKYFGPYQVIKKVGSIAYKLQPLESSRIHPMFHISFLKRQVGSDRVVSSTLPVWGEEDVAILVLKAVLKRRVILRNQLPVIQWLIH
ncbi:hypothetical protein ACH5RR_003381 [Cinchona calisaya]|uniref:Tf2-1-like SH3-like domain-containing protein n=1 Tax=Cinchona calisaya TaxID=153742 RepID=A0ABD3AUT7_9GENT